jgi:chemotaxis signal transduction protein
VVDLARLAGDGREAPARFVIVEGGGRRIAVAVGEVQGIVHVDPGKFEPLPPLLAPCAAVEALGSLDGELFLVLATGRLVAETPAIEAIR